MRKVLISIPDSDAEAIVAVCGPQSLTHFCSVAAHALAETLRNDHGIYFDPNFADLISGAGATNRLTLIIAGQSSFGYSPDESESDPTAPAPKPRRRSPASGAVKRRPNNNVPRRTRSPRRSAPGDGSSFGADLSAQTDLGPVLPD